MDRPRRRAVVFGASMGGLLAARVLSDTFDEVVLIDRDRVRGVEGPRRGVPHGRHAHGLVARGQQILEQHFPGLTDTMAAHGAEPGDFNADIRWYVDGRRMKPGPTGLLSVPATRPLLEARVRDRALGLPGVVLREETQVLEPLFSPDRTRVIGARIAPVDVPAEVETIHADLVVDTTGRGSRTPAWLAAAGYRRPPEEKISIGLAYTTGRFRVRTDVLGDDLATIPAPTPANPRGALLYRVPGHVDLVEVSLTGMLGDHAPVDREGFVEFARSLPVPEIHEALRDAELVDELSVFQVPASWRRRYDRLGRLPRGFLLMGDALCSFNPLYAQGMTVAAMESLTLAEHVAEGRDPDPRAYFRDIARVIDDPWSFSAGADLGYPDVVGPRTPVTRLVNAYVSRLQRAAVHDSRLTEAFIRAAGLVDRPSALMRLRVLLRVLRSRTAPAAVPVSARPPEEPAGRAAA